MRILYIPDSYYLSNPIFLAIAKRAKGHENVYFDTRDPEFNTNTINFDADDILKHFDFYSTMKAQTAIRGSKDIRALLGFLGFKGRLHARLKYINPDVIVVTTDMGGYVNRACNDWAEKNGVPYIIVQSAFLKAPACGTRDAIKNRLGYLAFNKILGIPLFRRQEMYGCEKDSNYLFLWGTDFKKMYRGTCIEKNIRLVGNPVFDKMKRRLNWDMLTPNVLLCPSMFKGVISEENEAKIRKMYQDIIKCNQHVHFMIKIHPRETFEQYKELLKHCGKNYHITKYGDLYAMFRFTNVQVSLVSYSSFEAIVAGIPVILLGNHMLKFPFDQFDHEAILSVDSIEEFNLVLNKCLDKKYLRQFRKLRVNYLHTKLKYLGDSAEHIVNEIEAIVE